MHYFCSDDSFCLEIITLALKYIKYDPNYAEENEDEVEDMEDEGEEEAQEDEYESKHHKHVACIHIY